MLEVFCDEFYRWGYIEFSKLDQYIKKAFKETFMAKKTYMGKLGDYVN